MNTIQPHDTEDVGIAHIDRPARSGGGKFSETIRLVMIVLLTVIPIRYFVFQPFIVRGASMEPTFLNQEYLIVDEFSYLLREPHRGEVIVFRYPRDTRQFFIKRVIGLPGERVEISKGHVSIHNASHMDGVVLDEEYLVPPTKLTRPDIDIILGPRDYFVMGDNREFSYDSRGWGVLERGLITGRVLLRAWPLPRFGLIPAFSSL